ncbi:MAG: hypothetical protein RL226_244, partial [Bacteroidota bacterium]
MRRVFTFIAILLSISANAQITISATETEGCLPLPVNISVITPAPAAISSYLWTVTYPDNSIVTSSSNQYIDIFQDPGAYDITLTINGILTEVFNDFIVVHDNPVVSFSADDTFGCVPHCVQFTDNSTVSDGNIVSWSWDFGNGVISNQQNPQYCYNSGGSFTPILSVLDEFGCFNSISVPAMITVSNTFPNAQYTTPSTADCNPPVYVNFFNTSGGTGIVSSTWDFDNGFVQTVNGTGNAAQTFNAVGDYNVCLSVENANECVSTYCSIFSVVPPPVASFTTSSLVVCEGEPLVFESTTAPTAPFVSWDFNGDGVVDATGDSVSYAFSAPGVFVPLLEEQYSASCVGQSLGDVSITVLPGATAQFTSSDPSGCQTPFQVAFTNESIGGNITAYEWLIDGVSVATTADLTYDFAGYGDYDVALVVFTADGCSDTLLMQDYVTLAPPSITFGAPTLLCTGEPVILTNVAITTPEQISQILWDFNGDGIYDSSGNNPNYTYTDAGEYTIQVALTTVSGCTNIVLANSSTEVQPEVVAEFVASETITCAGLPVTFCTQMEENTTYSWNFDDNTGFQIVAFPDTCIVHDYLDTGYFDVTLSVSNLACNAFIHLEDYIYIGGPVALFDFNQDCSVLSTVYFTDTSIDADSLVWDFGDGSPLVIDVLNPTHTYPGPGTYTVTLRAFNFTTGCEDIRTAVVSTTQTPINLTRFPFQGCAPISPNFASTDYDIYPHWEIDFGNGTTCTATWNETANVWEVYTYYPDGTTVFDDFSFNSNWFPDVYYTQGGLYDVTLTVTDANGCVFTEVKNDFVNVYNDQFFSDFTPVILEGCDSVLIDFQPTGNFLASWQWTFSDGTTSTDLNPIHEFLPPWDYGFSATFAATDVFGCQSTVTHVIDLVAPPVPDFTVLTNPNCIGDTILIQNNSVGDIAFYYWDFGDLASGSNNLSTDPDPWHVFSQNGDYTVCLTAENTQGCQQSLCIDGLVNINNPVADFSYQNQINNCLFGVQFTNNTLGNLTCTEWDFGDNQFASSENPFHTYPIGVYDVELVVCNDYGCTDTLLVPDIFNYSNVIGPITIIEDQTSCAPFQTSFSAFNPNDNSFTYFWEFGDGFGDPNNNTVTSHTYTEPGTYCPSLIMEDTNGCPFYIECDNPIVVTEFTFEATPISAYCYGDSVSTVLSGADGYSFSNPAIVSLQGGTYWIDALASETLIVTGTFDDCSYDLPLDIIVNDLPLVSLAETPLVCQFEPEVTLSSGSPTGGTYFIDGAQASVFNPSNPVGSYLIRYEYTDGNGCENSIEQAVDIVANPLVELTSPGDFCFADAAVPLTFGSPFGGVYQLNGNTVVEFNPQTGVGEYELFYSFQDVNGCSSLDSVSFSVWPQPELSASDDVLCWEPSVAINADASISSGSIVEYVWQVNGETGTTATPDFIFNPQTAGNYTLVLTAVSDQACTAETNIELTVFASPEASMVVSDFCANVPEVPENTSTIEQGSIATYTWELDGNVISFDEDLQTLGNTAWGDHTIGLTIISDQGCEDSIEVPFYVHPVPELDLDVQDVCAEELFSIPNLTTIADGTVDQYTWGFGNGTTSAEFTPDVAYANAGTYTIQLSATSDAGCLSEATTTITVFPLPQPMFDLSAEAACAYTDLVLTDLSGITEGSIASLTWYLNNDQVGSAPVLTLNTLEPGTYDIGLVVVSNEGCMSSITENNALEIFPNPTSGFT